MSDQSMTVPEFIEYVAQVSEAMGWQAGVGGMETAGAIISYLSKHPEQLETFLQEGVFGWEPRWLENGRLTWHGKDGRVFSPDFARRARVIKQLGATK